MPLDVIGEPVTLRPVGTLSATLVTVPEPPTEVHVNPPLPSLVNTPAEFVNAANEFNIAVDVW